MKKILTVLIIILLTSPIFSQRVVKLETNHYTVCDFSTILETFISCDPLEKELTELNFLYDNSNKLHRINISTTDLYFNVRSSELLESGFTEILAGFYGRNWWSGEMELKGEYVLLVDFTEIFIMIINKKNYEEELDFEVEIYYYE